MTLHFSRNPNPRLAVAVARYLGSSVTYSFASPFAPDQVEKFRLLNPNQRLPILEEATGSLWEADAIACRLSRLSGTNFWRTDDEEPDMIRWISWGKSRFVEACDRVHFEFGTKQRYGFGPVDPAKVAEGLVMFGEAAAILEAELSRRDFLLRSGLSYADFRMATFLPFNDVAGLPLEDYPALFAWYGRLQSIPTWQDPFIGLDAPLLPEAPSARARAAATA